MLCICTLSIHSVMINVHDMITRGCLHRTVRRIPCAQYMNSGILNINYLCAKTLLMRPNRCVEISLWRRLTWHYAVLKISAAHWPVFLRSKPEPANVNVLCCYVDWAVDDWFTQRDNVAQKVHSVQWMYVWDEWWRGKKHLSCFEVRTDGNEYHQ
jgi:hypothetical protein